MDEIKDAVAFAETFSQLMSSPLLTESEVLHALRFLRTLTRREQAFHLGNLALLLRNKAMCDFEWPEEHIALLEAARHAILHPSARPEFQRQLILEFKGSALLADLVGSHVAGPTAVATDNDGG
jgi:hypothetical protein